MRKGFGEVMLAGKSLVACALLFLLGACLRAEEAPTGEEAAGRYEKLLFAGGLAPRENLFTGRVETPVFKVQDVTDAGTDGRLVVAWSTEQPVPGGDGVFELGLAVVREGESPELLSRQDLTEKIPEGTEFPGNVLGLCAKVTELAASPGQRGLHLNVWAVLSGTGSISAASDFFFLIGADGELSLALELTRTSQHARLGVGEVQVKDSHLRLVDINGDETPEIVVEERSRGTLDGTTTSARSSVYRLDHGRYRGVQVGPDELAAALAAAGSARPVLERCPEIPPVEDEAEVPGQARDGIDSQNG